MRHSGIRRVAARLVIGLCYLVLAWLPLASHAQFTVVGSAANGKTDYESSALGCLDCHSDPPAASPNDNRPGANNAAILTYAFNNFSEMSAYTGMSTAEKQDIAAYIGLSQKPNVSNASGYTVPYNSAGTGIDVNSFVNTCTTDANCQVGATPGPNGTATSVSVVSGPSRGTVTSISGSVFTYKPTAGQFGTDSFTYKASGPAGSSGTATVSLTISNPPAPTLPPGGIPTQTINYATPATTLSINLAPYITNPATSVTVTSAPSKGTITGITGLIISYLPTDPNYGADSFGIKVTGPGGNATGSVPVSINVASGPSDSNSSIMVAYNSSTAIDLTALVTPFLSPTSFTITQQPSNGPNLVPNGAGSVTYAPGSAFLGGTDSFKFTSTGPGGNGNVATVNITVGNPPAPIAAATSTSVAFGSTNATLPLSVTNPYTSVSVSSAPAHGTTSISGTTLTYTPTAGYVGADQLSYQVGSPGGTSSAAVISITVPQPAAPTVSAASASTSFNTAKVIDLTSSVGGFAQGVAVVTAPGNGGTAVAGTGANAFKVTYTPANNYAGADSFTYQAIGYPTTNVSATTATVSVTIAGPGAAVTTDVGPVAIAFNAGATSIPLAANITSGGPYSVTLGTAAHGTVSVTGSTASYTPNAGYFGSDSFTYFATNASGASNTSTVHLSIANPPAPVAAGRTLSSPYNGHQTLDLTSAVTGVFTGLSVATAPGHGTASFSGNVVTYTPTSNYFGADSFTYIASGPGGNSGPATISVTVANPAAPLVAAATLSVAYASMGSIDLSHSVTGVFSSITLASPATHGSVSLSGNIATYTPASLYFGADSFSYSATGPGGTSATATVSVTVGLPGAPTLQTSTLSVTYNTPATINLAGSAGGVFSSFAIATAPSHGTATLSGSTLTYTPTSAYFGADVVQVTSTGPGGTSPPAAINITVVRPNPPVANPTSFQVAYNKTGTVDVTSLVTGLASSIAITTAPQYGTAVVNGFVVTYTPNAGYFGADSFSYAATGPGGTSAPASVSLTVQTLPVHAWDTTLSVPMNGSGSLALGSWITGAGVTGAVLVGQPVHGTASIAGTTLNYTPRHDYFGTDKLTYHAFGATGTSNTGTITITVTGRPDPSQNADVQGIVTSEMSSAQRFGRAQIGNFQSHLQTLHSTSIDDEDATQGSGDSKKPAPSAPGSPGGAPGASPGYSANPQQTLPIAANQGASESAAALPIRSSAMSSSLGSVFGSNPGSSPGTASSVLPNMPSVMRTSAPSGGSDSISQSMFGSATMQRTAYFPGTPPSINADPGLASQSITSLDLGSLAGGMLQDQNAASLDHTGLSSVWILGSVNFGERTPGGTTQNFDTDGISFGIDDRLTRQLVIGLGAGYGRDKTSIGTDGSRTRSTGVDVSAYASYAPTDHTFVDAVAGAGSLDFDATRAVAPINADALSHRSGNQLFVSVAAGYEWHQNGMHVTPYGRIDATRTTLNQATEQGAGAYDLNYQKQNQTSVQAALGLRLDTTQQIDDGAGVVRPHVTFEYQHEFDNAQDANLSYADLTGTTYTVAPNVLDRNAETLGIGADFLFRHGLTLGWDYEVVHAGGVENSQVVRIKLSQDLDQNFVLPIVNIRPLANVRADLGYNADDNVTRSTDKLSDQSWSLGLSRIFVLPFNENARVSLEPSAGFEKFETYVGLSHADVGLKAELQYRSTGDFSSPTYALFARLGASNFESTLRDGERYQLGVSGFMPLSDRINGFAAIGVDNRHARSDVFDNTDGFVRASLDYALTTSGTIYLNGEYRNGDMVSTGFPSLVNLDTASVLVRDDAFPGTGRIAYRFKGTGGIGSLGYNLGISSTSSLDLSYRIVTVSPDHQPNFVGAPTVRYVDHQLSLVYLVRF